jgi:hypothetical protein
MAWSISITVDGWQEIHDKLERWDREVLIEAICDDTFEMVIENSDLKDAEEAASAERERLEDLPHDVLVDRAYELVEVNNTCENGGYGYWIDREGYHRVWLKDTD